MYAFVKKCSIKDEKIMWFSINSFEYYNEVMHKNFFVKSKIKKEKDHLLTNIRDDSDNVVRGLNEKISTDQADNKKQYLISQFRKIQSNCQIYNSNTDSESIPKDVVRNIFYYGNNIGSRLNTFPIRNNQSIKDAATLKKDNTKESLGWDSIISSADDTKENSNTVSSRLDTLPIEDNQFVKDLNNISKDENLSENTIENTDGDTNATPKTLINLDKSLEQKQLEQESSLPENSIPECIRTLPSGLSYKCARIHSKKEVSEMRNTVQSFFKKLVDKNSLCMRVSAEEDILNNIMTEHFKNQFETKTSKGQLDFDKRMDASKKLFDIKDADINSFKAIDFEKYGYLGSPNPSKSWDTTFGYGPIKFIFNKRKISNRTTFTVGDSLNKYDENGVIIASRVTDPKIESIPYVALGQYDYLEVIYNLIKDNKIEPSDDPQEVAKTIGKENAIKLPSGFSPYIEYFELQYHGNLTMNDVEAVKISEDVKKKGKKKYKGIIQLLGNYYKNNEDNNETPIYI